MGIAQKKQGRKKIVLLVVRLHSKSTPRLGWGREPWPWRTVHIPSTAWFSRQLQHLGFKSWSIPGLIIDPVGLDARRRIAKRKISRSWRFWRRHATTLVATRGIDEAVYDLGVYFASPAWFVRQYCVLCYC